MKRKLTLILSFALCLCMLVGMLPFAAVADDPVAKDYDTANNGDLLYTVNFKGDDGVFDPTGYADVKTADVAKFSNGTATGSILTFSGKEAAATDFYGGTLKQYRIVGHVYTISYFIENPDISKYRIAGQFFQNGSGRVGFGTLTNGNISAILNGTYDYLYYQNMRTLSSRYTDANNRQYFKVVVNGITNVCTFYAQINAEGTFEYMGKAPVNPLAARDYLAIGAYQYDALGEASVSMGNVQIHKGDTINGNSASAYQTLYDNTAYGGTLYDVKFNSDLLAWPKVRDRANYTFADETTLTLNTTSGRENFDFYLPSGNEMGYGDYTYEFYLGSTGRTGVLVYGYVYNGNSYYSGGFAYNNGTTQFLQQSGNFKTASAFNDSSVNGNGGTATALNATQPNTSAAVDVNVKIEFEAASRTFTNWVYSTDGEWVKVSTLVMPYSNSKSFEMLPMVAFYAWNASATYKNFKVKKGLTVSDPTGENQAKYVSFTLDGEYQNGYKTVSAATLPTPSTANKAYYVNNNCLVDGSGNVITDKNALSLSAGYNLVELYSKYTPEFELRGYQSSLSPAANSTSIRLVGTIDTLTYESLGFKITAKWKDAEGVTHTGANTVDKNATAVYTSILAGSAAGCAAVTAESLGSEYIVAIAINGVPTGENVQVDFTVTPYLVDNGEPFEYPAQIISFVNGVYSSNATPLA